MYRSIQTDRQYIYTYIKLHEINNCSYIEEYSLHITVCLSNKHLNRHLRLARLTIV